jgi:hypothetical protein
MLLRHGLASGEINVRATALAFAGAKTLRAMRKIPLRDVQAEYFTILDEYFGKPFSEMKKYGLNPGQIAKHVASQDVVVNAFEADLEAFASGMREFWCFENHDFSAKAAGYTKVTYP